MLSLAEHVDMEKKEPVEEALKVFEQYLTELEKLV